MQRKSHRRTNIFLLGFSTVLLATGSAVFAVSTKVLELMFVDNRNYPGGPALWYVEVGQTTSWIVASNAAYFFSEMFADGFLVSFAVIFQPMCGSVGSPASPHLDCVEPKLLGHDSSHDHVPLYHGLVLNLLNLTLLTPLQASVSQSCVYRR
jgi:hypothetical protein